MMEHGWEPYQFDEQKPLNNVSGRSWCARASSTASTQKSLSRVLDSRHASTLRLYQSITATR